MRMREEFAAARAGWRLMTLYQKFEHAVILALTALISIIVALAVWNVTLADEPARSAGSKRMTASHFSKLPLKGEP